MNTTSNNDINYQSNDNLQFPEIGSPSVGPYISPTFNQNLSYNDQIYGTMVCYNCLSVLLIRHDWNYAKCGECQKINKIPHRNISSNQNSNYNIYNNSNNFYDDSQNMSDLLGDIPYVYGIVNCPFCSTENKISIESPLGKSLLGKKIGDIVNIKLENGSSYSVEVIAIIKEDLGEDNIKQF